MVSYFGITPHTQGKAWYNPTNYDFGLTELGQKIGNSVNNALGTGGQAYNTNQGGSNLINSNLTAQAEQQRLSALQQQPSSVRDLQTQNNNRKILGVTDVATDNNNKTTLTGGGETPPQPPRVEETNNSGGGDPFAHINSVFDSAMGNFASRQAEANQGLRDIASSRKQGIQQQLENQLPQVDTYRENVRTDTAKTLAELAADLRNSSQNTMNFLGGLGAGNTSAVDHAAFALSKEFGRNRANVQQQASDQLAELDLVENNLRTTADQLVNEVDTWLSSNLAEVANQFNNARGQLDFARANSMLDQLRAMEMQANQFKSEILSNAQNRLASLNDYKIQLQQSGAFNPQDIVAQEFAGINGGLMDQANMLTNSVFGRNRRDDERLV